VLLRPIESRIRPDPVVDVPDDLIDIDDDNLTEPVAASAAAHLAVGTEHGPVRLSHLLGTITTNFPVAVPAAERPEATSSPADAGAMAQDDDHREPAPGSSRDPGPSVADVVWAGSLWAWVNNSAGADEDDGDGGIQPRNRHLAGVLSTLAAVDDGTRLAEGLGYTGADLVVGRAHHLLTDDTDLVAVDAVDGARSDRANEDRVGVP
jgi:hypothetical protein